MHENRFHWTWGHVRVAPHKSVEYQLEFGKRANFHPFEFSLRVTEKHDHAGASFTFGVGSLYWFSVRLYDERHWDPHAGDWIS